MKLRNIITCLSIFILFALTVKAGWIQKSEFKELERKIPGTNLITFDDTGNYFYTFSGDSCLRRWDVNTGEVLDSIKITFRGNYTTASFSSDKKVFCIASTKRSTAKNFPGGIDSTFIQAYSLTTFRIVDENNSESGFIIGYGEGGTSINQLDYISEKGYFRICTRYSKSTTVNWHTSSSVNGSLVHISDTNNINSIKISGNEIRNCFSNKNIDRFVAVGYYQSLENYHPIDGNGFIISNENSSIIMGNSDFENPKTILNYSYKIDRGVVDSSSSAQYYKIISALINQYDSNIYFLIDNSNILKTYDYSGKVFLKDYEMPSAYSYWINMSEDSRFLFLTYANHLRILHPQTKTQIVEFNFDNYLTQHSYDAQNSGLITLSKSNTIELWYPKEFVEGGGIVVTDTVTYMNTPISFYFTGLSKTENYIWDFGDGETAQGISAIHSYKKTGIYSVKLDLIDSSGKIQTITKNNLIEIIDSLLVDFEVSEKDTNDYHIVKFKNNSKGDITSTLWDFGDGSSDTVFNPVHQYKSDWLYNVTLQVSDKLTKLKKSLQVSVFDSVTKIASDYNEKNKLIYLTETNCSVTEGHIENFKISPSGNYYIKYFYGSSFEKMYGHQFTIFDDNLEQKYYKTNYTGKNFYFLNKETKETILFLNNSEYSKYSPFFETEYDHYSGSYNDFILMDNNQNIWGFYQPSSELLTLNEYEIFGPKIQSYPLSYKAEDYEIVTTDKYLYYRVNRSFGKINLQTNLLDTFSLKPINEMSENNATSIGLLGLKSGAIFVSVFVNNYTTIIYKLNEKNEIVKTFSIDGSKIMLNKLVPIGENLFGFIGSSLVQSYLILDSDLNIIYKKFFLGYPRDFEDLSLKNQNQIVLASSKMNQDKANFYFVTDTLPNWIVDRYLTSVQNPKTSNSSDFLQVYPNPASDYITLNIPPLEKRGLGGVLSEISIFDIYGNCALNVGAIHELPLRIDISSLPAGVYFVRIGEKVEKFVKIR